MKKSIKVALAIILTVLLTATCATVAVFAATDEIEANTNGMVCRIGAEGTGTYYTTIAAAVSAAKDGDVITVIKDTTIGSSIDITEDITLTSEKTVTVTCNANNALKIGATGTPANVTVAGNLQIFASGTYNQVIQMIEGKAEIKDNVYLKSYQDTINLGSSATSNKAEVIIWGGTVEATNTAELKGAIYLGKEGSKATIKGGTIQGNTKSAAVRLFGKNAELNVEGGTLTATTNTIYCEGKQNQKLNISKGTVEALTQHAIKFIKNANVTTTISGGTVTAPKITVMYEPESSGSLTLSGSGRIETTNGNQCVYLNHDAGKTVDFTMTGGTLEANGDNSLYMYNSGTANVNISGGKIKGNDGIVRSNKGTNIINISGGEIEAKTKTINSTVAGTKITISDNAIITATGSGTNALRVAAANHDVKILGGTISAPATAVNFDTASGGTLTVSDGTIKTTSGNQPILFSNKTNAVTFTMTGGTLEAAAENAIYCQNKGITATISGGTLKAKSNTLSIGASSTFDITGGTIIATESVAIKGTGTAQTTTFNISGDAKVYAGKQAILSNNDGLTFNISGGTFTASKEHTPADNSSLFVIVTQKGTVNITGGKFILGGTNNGAQMIYQDATATGTTTVDGGLFINDNKVNKTIFSKKINYISGRILYGKNIDTVISGTAAPKTVKAAYGTADNVYFFYTRFAATNADYAGTMNNGASIRITKGSTGMRFTTTFDEIEGATYGTVIVPASYLANLNSFTLEALVAANLKYLNIVADQGVDVADGKVTIRAAITNIDPANYTTAFAAIAYVKVGDTYYYTAFDLEDNARTVDFVATEALDDLKESKTDEYQNKINAYGVTLYSPYTATQRETIEGFVTVTLNVPRPTGATLVNCGDGTYMYYVASAKADTHTAYAASLVTAGFTQTATNDLEGNIYTTYTKGNQIVTVAYTPKTSELRVIMDMATNSSLPSNEQYTAPAAPVATTLTQIGQLYDDPATEDIDESTATETKSGDDYITNFTAGMGYVIRLEDGSFIVIDGGYKTEAHADNLYNVLKKQANGDDIVIAAWIFTHAHSDHVGTFEAFTSKYASSVTVKRFIYNFPAKEATVFADDDTPPNYTAIKNAMNKYDGAVTTIAHAGQVFNIANAKVNILFTYEMMQPNKELDYYNGCSVVFNVEVEGKTILFLADAGGDSITKDRELTYIKKIYTAQTLKADIVQAAHHGIDDLGNDYITLFTFYDLVDADIMLIPVADRFVKIDADSYVNIYDRAAYKQSGDATKYLAGSTVTVLTLDNGNVSVQVFDTVANY